MKKRRLYLDNNATTPLAEGVFDAMLPYLKDYFGNAGSVHKEGRAAAQGVSEAREALADLLGCRLKEIIFTGSGTEANNLALRGAALYRRGKSNKTHILAIATEHESVLEPLKALENEGFEVDLIPVDAQGHWHVDDILARVREETAFVSAAIANYELGTIHPIAELGAALKERDIWLHCDAAMAPGWLDLDVRALGVDFLSLSAHKFGGPKGAGVLFARQGVKLMPLMTGGYQERRRRPGAENVAAIVGMGVAAKLAKKRSVEDRLAVAALRDAFVLGIKAHFDGLVVLGSPDMPHMVNLSLPPLEGEALLLSLDMEGMAVSSGAACTSGTLEPSHVMDALGVDAEVAQGSIRVSLGFDWQEADIDDAIARTVKVIKRLTLLQSL